MTTVCLSDLINLSFGNCEIRNIKFRVLQWCLQVIAHQLDFGGLLVEFRGNDSSFIQNEIHSVDEVLRKKIFTTVVDEHRGNVDVSKTDDVENSKDAAKKKQVVVIENGQLIEKVGKRPRTTSPSSTSSLGRLEGRIRNLQAQIDNIGSTVLPSDQGLIQKLRLSQEAKPVTDLLNTMKITKRMSGAEEEIDRIASLLEVVAREYDELKKILNTIHHEFGHNIYDTLHQIKVVSGYINNIRPREAYYHTTLSKRLLRKKDDSIAANIKKTDNETVSDPEPQECTDHKISKDLVDDAQRTIDTEMKAEKLQESDIVISRLLDEKWNRKDHELLEERGKTKSGTNLVNNDDEFFEVLQPVSENIPIHVKTLNKLLKQHEQLKLNFEFLTVQVNTLADFAEIILSELVRNTPNIEALKEKIREIHLSPSEYKKTKSLKRKVIDIHMEICYRIDNIEGTISKYAGKIQLQDDVQEENVKNLLERIEQLEIGLDDTMKNVNLLQLEDNKDKDEIIEKLVKKTDSLDGTIEMIDIQTNSILKDIKSHEVILKALQDNIEKLKSVKLDRFEFDELLSDKASIMQLNSKVSVDQFTQAYRFLTKSIERSSEKISTQKLFWKKWIDFFEETLETKLGIEDFHELAKKLTSDTKRMVNILITSAYGEYGLQARGGKSKFLKNLQCVSCDREVIMKMENDYPNLPILPKLAGHKVKTLKKELPEQDEFSSETLLAEKLKDIQYTSKDQQVPLIDGESTEQEEDNEELKFIDEFQPDEE
ncbi:unnamed protein product [Nezara viridula]|uniref:DUF4795 domain-containing protein n=1 Tax=Nezara viridula TaxID=85310 RepID=A0A9P0H1K6_NEZVI|nr:unnamed protein product [Nezara viridula]